MNQAGVARRALVASVAAALGAALVLNVVTADEAAPTGGTVDLGTVQCTALINGSPISQSQAVSVTAFAPDDGGYSLPFEASFPGGTVTLPSTGAGIPIRSFANLFTTWEVVNGYP